MDSRVKVFGLKEFNDFCKQMPQRVERNVMRAAMYAGAVVFRDQARVLAPVRRGRLRKNIVAKRGRGKPGIVEAKVGVDVKKAADNAFYWRFVEMGTSGGYLMPYKGRFTRRKALSWPGAAHPISRPVTHPGIRARRFLTGSFNMKHNEALSAIVKRIKAGMVKEAARYGYKVT